MIVECWGRVGEGSGFESFPLLALKDWENILTVVCRPRFEPWSCRMHVRSLIASANLLCSQKKWNFCGLWNTLSGCNEIIQCCRFFLIELYMLYQQMHCIEKGPFMGLLFVFLFISGRLQLKCDAKRWRREGKWRGNCRMEWVAGTLHTTSEHGVSSITTAYAHTSAASSRLNWRPKADLNGLVRFAERRNLVSARVPSHFMWPLPKLLNISTLQIRTIDHEMIYRGVLALLGGPTAYGVQTAQKMSERGGGGRGGGGRRRGEREIQKLAQLAICYEIPRMRICRICSKDHTLVCEQYIQPAC